jgi:hypothetical protein
MAAAGDRPGGILGVDAAFLVGLGGFAGPIARYAVDGVLADLSAE